MAHRYPSFNDYQAALQNPRVYFTQPMLRNSVPELDLWGLPRVRSGGFALTYRMTSKEGQDLAVRCFHKPVDDRAQRYAAINAWLIKHKESFFLPVHYLAKGITLKEQTYPVTYMDWVDGETLESWLYSSLDDLQSIHDLCFELVTLADRLAELGVAHGDLSHRNIMVKDRKLILVDYDGMYVPVLEGRASTELGNIHFQHPARTSSDFNERLDRFSEIVLYLALAGLARRPQLWNKYQAGGEGLLFNRANFLDPFQSPLLQELETLTDLRGYIQAFRQICNSSLDSVPSLSDFLAMKPGAYSRVEITQKTVAHPKITYMANDRFTILRNLGKMATVVGYVTDVFRGTTPDGHTHVFINLGSWKAKCFTIILWDKALELLKKSEIDPGHFVGSWVSVTGVLTAFNHRPQIAVDLPTEIEILPDEAGAMQRYEAGRGKYSRPWTIAPIAPSKLQSLTSPEVKTPRTKKTVDLADPISTIVQTYSNTLVTGGLDVPIDVLKKLASMYAELNSGHESSHTDSEAPGVDNKKP
jgi:hypothetical protein